MKHKVMLMLALALFCGYLYSQPAKIAVLRVNPFSSSTLNSSETAMIERLISSYIAEMNLFRIIDSAGQDMALTEAENAINLGIGSNLALPLSADFILTGSIGKIGDIFVLSLEITKVSTGEKISASDTASSINDIVLRARVLTRSLFKAENPNELNSTTFASPIASSNIASSNIASSNIASSNIAGSSTEADISIEDHSIKDSSIQTTSYLDKPELKDLYGTWRGDKGLESIRILPNNSAIAVLSGGGSIKLRITIEAASIVIYQDQANDPNMYRSSAWGFEQAKLIAELARPMRWLFNLSLDKNSLVGIKETSAVSGSGSNIKVDNNYVRDAQWSRVSP